MNLFFKNLFNVPNSISIFRIIGTPFLAFFWLGLDMPKVAFALGIIVGLTDLFDGILARKLNQITEIGSLLDQLGDLIFEATNILIAIAIGEIWVGWMIIYLFREFTVTVIRTWIYSNGGVLRSSWIGKAKSACIQWGFFLVFLGIIMNQPGQTPTNWIVAGITPSLLLSHAGMLSVIMGIFLGLLSGWQYLKTFVKFYISKIDSKSSF